MKNMTFRFLSALFLFSMVLVPLWAQDITDTKVPLDESLLFGGEEDIVRVIDTNVAAASMVELVAEKKTYPVFLLEGTSSVGMEASYVPYGSTIQDTQSLFGTVKLSKLSLSFLPSKDYVYNISTSGNFSPAGAQDLTTKAYADLRTSEFTRLYVSASYSYNLTTSGTSLVTADEGFLLNELFVDTAIDRKYFFRLGKQRVRWGVGNWYRPADILSLSAIDPDNPLAQRDGPYAFKIDMPFGLNHATLFIVPPLDPEKIGQFSIAEKTDFVVGGFELSLAGFYRTDMVSKPRAMATFSGAIGNIDIYGENVLAWGSDRIYVRSDGLSGYETYTLENRPVFQSTLGLKYSLSSSDGFGLNLHLQGYYNGAGYEDSSILRNALAVAKIKEVDGYTAADTTRSGAGMYYLAGNLSFSFRSGSGNSLVNYSLGGYGLHNFSDGSTRIRPSYTLTLGSGGSRLSMELSALSTFGAKLSEYAPAGNTILPAFSMTIANQVKVSVSAPLRFDQGFTLTRAGGEVGITWSILDFEKR
jgi:hypothetical protein